MEFFPVPDPPVLDRCDLTSGSHTERTQQIPDSATRRRSPAVNHEASAFIENKRCWTNPRATGDVVNRNAAFVYQTDALLDLISHSRPRERARERSDETVQSTSMFRNFTL